MDIEKASDKFEAQSKSGESVYLNLAEMAARMGVSPSTVARYRSEFAAYLNPFGPPGGGRGLRPEAVKVLEVIKEMKSRRASWIEIKQALEAEFGIGEAAGETLGTQSFRRSLEAIHQAQQVMANELHLLMREINRRLEQLEKGVRRTRLSEKSARERPRKGGPPSTASRSGNLFSEKEVPSVSDERLGPEEPED